MVQQSIFDHTTTKPIPNTTGIQGGGNSATSTSTDAIAILGCKSTIMVDIPVAVAVTNVVTESDAGNFNVPVG
jgi:hypothetical protein